MKPINPRKYFGPNGGPQSKLQCTAILDAIVGVELCYITKQVTQNRYNLAAVAHPARTLKRCVLVEGTPVHLGEMHITVTPYAGPLPPQPTISGVLHTAAPFAVLAGAAVTNTGSSVVTGDVGAVTAITPGPWTVHGTVHTVDDAATVQALVDAQAAYNTLSVLPATTLTGDLGGKILTPGVYSYATSAGLTGTLTLDFQGLSNQQIVIIMGSTLTTASASVVHIVNSNASNNVFFVVGSSATLGTTTSFAGNILAQTSVTLTTGATVQDGNVIAITGSVTMDSNASTATPSAPIPQPVGAPLSAEKIMSHIAKTFEDDGSYEWLPLFAPATDFGEANIEHA